MYRFFKISFVAAALMAAPAVAQAADARPPAYRAAPAVPYYDWSGFYAGAHIGFGTTDNDSGVLGGGQVGFNYQINQWVLGVEGTFSATNIGESATVVVPGVGVATANASLDWLTTVAFRAGWAFDRWLVYGKFGAAWASVSADATATVIGGPTVAVSIDDRLSGWVIGVGTEYAFLNNWSAKFEYNMLDFGNDLGHDATVHVFKAGLNYRFTFGPGGFRGAY
jgi:outer membrane immunogenic protein